jgi:hypothetical protein
VVSIKAACLQIHVNFHMQLKVQYCDVNQLSNLDIEIGAYNPRKLTKSGQHKQKQPLHPLLR